MQGGADGVGGAADGARSHAQQELVTGFAEHRASLVHKKAYRKSVDIDMKLPEQLKK